MPEPADSTHYLGDDCPWGHHDDPYLASQLNDELLEQQVVVEIDGPIGGATNDRRQAALFAAIQYAAAPQWSDPPSLDTLLDIADQLLAWLDDGEAEHDG